MGEKGIDAMFHAALEAEIRKRGRGAQAWLSRELGKSPQYISQLIHMEIYGGESSRRDIARILGYDYEDFLELGRQILEAKGEVIERPPKAFLRDAITTTVILASEVKGQVEIKTEDYYAAPLVEGKIAAGSGSTIFEDEVRSLVWIYAPALSDRRNHNLVAVEIGATNGDSMEPTLMPGDIVLIDRDEPKGAEEKLISGAIYAVRDGLGGCMVKRVYKDDEHLVLGSDNRKHNPKIAWTESVHELIIGRVVWSWRNMLKA